MSVLSAASGGEIEAGFAKLQGEDFEYYMQTYSIILGRNSKKLTVDVDLSSLGGGMNISRHHARIFYDFQRRRFALEVLGKNGCFVEGVLHLPDNPPVKLDSQDLLQIGDKKFYFLLPVRSILLAGHYPRLPAPTSMHLLPPPPPPSSAAVYVRKGRPRPGGVEYRGEDGEEDDEDEGFGVGGAVVGKKLRPDSGSSFGYASGLGGSKASQSEKRSEARSRIDRDTDSQQLLQTEEKDVVSCVANVLSDLCGPGEWMPMGKLHAELLEQYGNAWHHSRVRKYLASEDWPIAEASGKPWFGLLTLLRKYPEHFVINTRSKGRVTSEFVSLVSLLT